MVLTPPLMEGLYKVSSDLSCMSRGELHHDQHTTLLSIGHIRSAKPALAQPNRMRKRNVQVLHVSAGFSDCNDRELMLGKRIKNRKSGIDRCYVKCN